MRPSSRILRKFAYPRPRSPSRFASGTRAFSNVSGCVSDEFQPTLSYAGSAVKPGVPLGMMIVEISGFSVPSAPVRVPVTAVAVTNFVMSVPEFVMNDFDPFTTHSPFSSTALVRVPPASEPASASVSPNAASPRPSMTCGSSSARCSSVPKRWIGIAPSDTPASRVIASDWFSRAISSSARHRAK